MACHLITIKMACKVVHSTCLAVVVMLVIATLLTLFSARHMPDHSFAYSVTSECVIREEDRDLTISVAEEVEEGDV